MTGWISSTFFLIREFSGKVLTGYLLTRTDDASFFWCYVYRPKNRVSAYQYSFYQILVSLFFTLFNVRIRTIRRSQ